MLSQNIIYYGSDEDLPQSISLRAGPLTVLFEHGDLRYIRLGEREVLRRMYVAIRDENWRTASVELTHLQIDAADDSFHISFDEQNRLGGVDFAWHGEIVGTAEGMIRFQMDGQACGTFLRNRIGFCVLHPMDECAGQPCTVEHTDGAFEHGYFPQIISPHQPFLDMRAIRHTVQPEVQAEVRFEGDTFEMEDQRNWTDASFKTYCTPLSLPKPVRLQIGQQVRQAVTLELISSAPVLSSMAQQDEVVLTLHPEDRRALPHIGLGVASHGHPLSERELALIKRLKPSHLRLDLYLADDEYPQKLRQAVQQAVALDAGLEMALFISGNAERELQHLVHEVLPEIKPPVGKWLIFHKQELSTRAEWVTLARKIINEYDEAAVIGGGSNAYFTQLNRERPAPDVLDVIAYPITPQVHAFDQRSLVENLPAQRVTLESARLFAAGRPLALSPITFKPRHNPDAHTPEVAIGYEHLPSAVDARQMSLFGAGWTLGSLKSVIRGACQSVTYYETTGWRGVMETEAGSDLPGQFHSLPGMVFPLYYVFADVGEFRGGEMVSVKTSTPLVADGMALVRQNRLRLLLANFTNQSQRVRVVGLSGGSAYLRSLDETSIEVAYHSPDVFLSDPGELTPVPDESFLLTLRPYAIARLDMNTA